MEEFTILDDIIYKIDENSCNDIFVIDKKRKCDEEEKIVNKKIKLEKITTNKLEFFMSIYYIVSMIHLAR